MFPRPQKDHASSTRPNPPDKGEGMNAPYMQSGELCADATATSEHADKRR